jgi:hypothetical protein
LESHVHPLPDIDTGVSPLVGESVTVTVPVVGPPKDPLLTAIVYVTPFCPWVKLPVCVLVALSAGPPMTTVESLALAGAEPPPDTLTWLTCGVVALPVTFTVTVMGG